MNFDFSDEQKMLRDQARTFLNEKSPLSVARRVLEGEEARDENLWQEMVTMGWTATHIPEEYGGIGLGYLELCVIAEELGRSLAPVPFSSSVYLATEGLLLAATPAQKEQYLPGLADGSLVGTLALAETAGSLRPDRISTTIRDGRLRGHKVMVPDGDYADFSLVLARDDEGALAMVVVDLKDASVNRQPMKTIDPARSHARILFDDTPCVPLGKKGEGMTLAENILDRASVLFAFEQVGGSEAALQMAKTYALERYTFGRPVASYQAIKHKLARMYVAATLAKSNAYYAAWALSTSAPELPVASAAARVSAIKAYKECSEENIQTHGGNGFTWEFDCHLFYRRAKLLSVNTGSERAWKHKLINRLEAAGAHENTAAW